MDHLTKKVDIHKIFYFLHYEPYTELFNQVWMQWHQSGLISAPVPSINPMKMKVKSFSNSHGHLIFSIYKSTLLKFNQKIHLSYQHPNDYEKKQGNTERNPDNDRPLKAPKPDDGNPLNPNETPNSKEIDFRAFRAESLYDDDFPAENIFAESTPMGRQQDRGGKTTFIPSPGGKLTQQPGTNSWRNDWFPSRHWQ